MKKIDELIKGHENFKKFHFQKFEGEFSYLVQNGQSPEILFIGCSDSRVVPDLITGSKPGDLFIVRNVGNFVPPFKADNDFHGSAAAIEYAVSVLNVKHIIVCGHSFCGACESLFKDLGDSPDLVHVKKWLELGNKPKEFVLSNFENLSNDEVVRITEQISIIFQLENLITYPAVARKLGNNEISIHGWYYKIETGVIEYYDSEKYGFFELNSKDKK